jgi:predicted DNA-binding transcriptional regulator AlpA
MSETLPVNFEEYLTRKQIIAMTGMSIQWAGKMLLKKDAPKPVLKVHLSAPGSGAPALLYNKEEINLWLKTLTFRKREISRRVKPTGVNSFNEVTKQLFKLRK